MEEPGQIQVSAHSGYSNLKTLRKIKDLSTYDFYVPDQKKQAKDSKRGRRIQFYKDEYLIKEMRDKLDSEEGKKIYSKRKQIIEKTFADIKEKQGFRKFRLRGLEKVNIEGALIGISYNLWRVYHFLKRKTKDLSVGFKEAMSKILGENKDYELNM